MMDRFSKAVEQAKKALLDAFEITEPVDEAIDKYDLVEVVRCKDCVHWKDEGFDSAGKCELWNIVFEYDWFCADGERKEQNDE